MPKKLSIKLKDEEELIWINVLQRRNFLFQRIDLVLGWKVPYIVIYDGDRPYNKTDNNVTVCIRYNLLSSEIIHCKDGRTEWEMGYYEMDQFIKFLKRNLREEYPSLPELSLWDYICYLYNKETGDTLLEMPDYQSICPAPYEEVDGFEDYCHNLSKELLEDRDIYDQYMISENMHIFLPISRYNDLTTDRTHFIISDHNVLEHCTKAARISFIEPKYLHCSDVDTEEWILSEEEINILINTLSKDDYKIWNNILECRDDVVKGFSLQLAPLIGIPMPDYTKLL